MEPMKRVELGKYVVTDPAICHGKLTFKGTRVLVGPVLAAFARGGIQMGPPLVVVDEQLRYDRVTEPLRHFVTAQQIGPAQYPWRANGELVKSSSHFQSLHYVYIFAFFSSANSAKV